MALVPDIKIRFSVDDNERELRFVDVPYGTWEELKRARGFTPSTLLGGVGEGDIEAVVSLLWLERRQTNPAAPYRDSVRELEKSNGVLLVTDILMPNDEGVEPNDEDKKLDPTISGDNS